MSRAAKDIIFYYDVICPYAYLASRLVEKVAENVGAKVKWRPVLLGGIYKATKPTGEETTKAHETMNAAKKQILFKDLLRQYSRQNIASLPFNSIPDISTLGPMRLLAACEDDGSELRKNLSHELYHNLWAEKKDVSDIGILQEAVKKFEWDVDVESITSGQNPTGKELLLSNTQEAVERGSFGVPSFWVNNNKLYFGADRLDFVARALGDKDAAPHRLLTRAVDVSKKPKLTIFHDFASPYCFIMSRRIKNLIESVSPVEVEVEWVPVLLGAVFKAIGSPQMPVFTAGEAKRRYIMQEVQDLLQYLSINDFQFPSGFPHASLTALRTTIANSDQILVDAIYNAAWTKNADIGDLKVLADIIEKSGFNANELFAAAQTPSVKDKLKENTQRALSLGICGVPSFQVDDQPLIWGQDRLNIVADELLGWQDPTEELIQSFTSSKL